MLQNKLIFNQSSVSLEIIGLPDFSNNEDNDQISIISQWKLMIINKPLIEGNFEHLISIMNAFYNYSNYLINNEAAFFESNLIDIKEDNYLVHNILLKSSKKDVKPLNIKIGNAELSDIINCFDQFNSSNKVKKVNLKLIENIQKKSYFNILNIDKLSRFIMPPLLSLCSLLVMSSTLIYFYNSFEDKEKKAFINENSFLDSVNSTNTIL